MFVAVRLLPAFVECQTMHRGVLFDARRRGLTASTAQAGTVASAAFVMMVTSRGIMMPPYWTCLGRYSPQLPHLRRVLRACASWRWLRHRHAASSHRPKMCMTKHRNGNGLASQVLSGPIAMTSIRPAKSSPPVMAPILFQIR